MNISPEKVFEEFEAARRFKASIGRHGLYEQNKINERFYIGDQWHGAAVGNERPLVRHNVIKRIGDYKIAELLSSPVSVKYSAEGRAETNAQRDKIKELRKRLSAGEKIEGEWDAPLMLSALNSYYKVEAERLRLSGILEKALRDAYIRGTGAVYTYFDPDVKTGLYAGERHILGDIVCETLKIEDIYFADAAICELQSQPYIILREEKRASELLFEAERFGAAESVLDALREKGEEKQTVLTRLCKEKDKRGETVVFAVRVTEKAVIRPTFSLGISLYPINIFSWERREESIYGESEITYTIPNQIAINRMITASTWSALSSGMPLMVVNGDIVSGEITNDPGQIIKVYGAAEEIDTAVSFVNPPDYSSGYNEAVEKLIYNTLTQSGANEAALGDLEATNTSAIIELREASRGYLLPLKNRFYDFVADIAKVWAQFFFACYGERGLKVKDENGVWYFPFDAERYRDIVLSVTAACAEGITKGEKEKLSTLNLLLEKGAITAAQYIKRLPSGMLDERDELLEELKEASV